jgi:TUG ubiquitin-like domain
MRVRNGKSTVDLSLPVRLANLAAGAKLDIYRIHASEGSRSKGSFRLTCSDETDYFGVAVL